MDSCARGAFLSGVGFLVSLNWLQAARVSNRAVARQRIRADSRGACSASMCIGCWSAHRSGRWALGEVVGPGMRDITIGQINLHITAEEDFRSLPKWAEHLYCGEMTTAIFSVSAHSAYPHQLTISHAYRIKDESCDESPVRGSGPWRREHGCVQW